MALLTMCYLLWFHLLGRYLLTMAALTTALLTVALLTMALLTVALLTFWVLISGSPTHTHFHHSIWLTWSGSGQRSGLDYIWPRLELE